MPRITPHRPPSHFARARPRVPSRTDRAYDAGARLTEVANTAANGEQVGVRYTLSADDQRVEALEETGQKWQYGYDGLKQLVTAKKTDTATSVVPPLDQSYSYDPMGNRRAYSEQGKSVAYAANSANQYTSISESGSNGASSSPLPAASSLVYDRNGNLLNDGVRAYTWDAENQLVAVTPVNPTEGSQRVEYTYDWRMRRKDKKSFIFANGAWTLARTHTFKYHEWNPIEETITEYASAGGSNGAPFTLYASPLTTLKSYIWGNDLSGNLHGAGGVGGLLSMKVSSFSAETSNLNPQTYFYAYDGNGNVRALVKADASNPAASGVAEKYAYDGFGREITAPAPSLRLSSWGFSSKQLDAETGMNYYGYRYYAADKGRWINRDVIKERGGLNMYAQCVNGMIGAFDMLGMWKKEGGVNSGRRMFYSKEQGDTNAGLATLVGLDSAEFDKWAKSHSANGKCGYTVPNVYMDLRLSSTLSWPGLGAAFDGGRVSPAGSKDVDANKDTYVSKLSEFKGDIISVNVYAHGWPNGDIVWSLLDGYLGQDSYRITTATALRGQVQQDYKLANLNLMYCYSGFTGIYFDERYRDSPSGEVKGRIRIDPAFTDFSGGHGGRVLGGVFYNWDQFWANAAMNVLSYDGVNVLTFDTQTEGGVIWENR